jgi:hypothetical protein
MPTSKKSRINSNNFEDAACFTENLEELSNSQLISLYGKLIRALKTSKVIRTKNVVGDLGERFAIDYYTRQDKRENLNDSHTGEKYIDSKSEQGNRYTIKSTTGNRTGTFHGLPKNFESTEVLFEFLLIVVFSDSYEVKTIYELTWEQFLKHKKWHSRMGAWYVSINKAVKAEVAVTYSVDRLAHSNS